MATQSIGSHHLAPPFIAHAQHHSCITSYHTEAPYSASHHIIALWHRTASHHILFVQYGNAAHWIVSYRITSHCTTHTQHRIALHRIALHVIAHASHLTTLHHPSHFMPQTRTNMLVYFFGDQLSGGLRPPHPLLSEECSSFYFCAVFCYDIRY